MKTKILVLASNPEDTAKLRLDKEIRAIKKILERAQRREKFAVELILAAQIEDLQESIIKEKPRIVHFCGHGSGRGGLVLQTELGKPQLVNNQALGGLFKLFETQVECVMLNACYSQTQAEVINKHINYVIGTKKQIQDKAAIAFAQGFYTALFNGEAIERAYEFGCNRIQLEIYGSGKRERKLVPVYSEERGEVELPQDEVLVLLKKEPLNQIEVEPEAKQVEGNLPCNIQKTGSANFVGREGKLEELHQLLQEKEKVTVSAIAGMGGIGKSELALQYALAYQNEYPGSLCWFSVRGENIGTQIIEYAGSYLNFFAPDELKTDLAKVQSCWQNWRSDKSLIVLDDVPDYGEYYQENVAPYLPPVTNQIKVLMTSRERPGVNIPRLDLDVLTEGAALELLEALIGKARIEAEIDAAKELCKWLGYLPLGLELVGRYGQKKKTLSIAEILQRLEKQKLRAKALVKPKQADMTAQLGVAAAFELSWDELNAEAQELGSYLSLFGSEPFKWSWVETAWIESTDEDEREEEKEELEELRDEELVERNLLKLTIDRDSQSSTEPQYQLHALIAEYFRAKLEESEEVEGMKQKFCQSMIAIAKSIPQTPTQEDIRRVAIAIPHLSSVAKELTDYVDDEDLIWSCEGIGRFYQGQGAYERAEEWYERSVTICRSRLGEEHPSVANSLNDLAFLYKTQGQYKKAEPLYEEALAMTKKLLGQKHPDVAASLHNLAGLYYEQGRYEKAELLYVEALEMSKKLLGQEHPSVATSLNSLALLYSSQGRYEKAEPLYVEALELYKKVLGQEHPYVATSLNNLAGLYSSQGRYEEAKLLYLEASEMAKRLLGQEHPYVANSLNNLAGLYYDQERYSEAEPLLIEALEMRKRLLGQDHPDVAQSLNNLAVLYSDQGRYKEAEPLLVEALEMRKRLLGQDHPNVALSLNNLAVLYSDQGRYEEAEPLLVEALEMRKKLLGQEHPDVATSLYWLAFLYHEQGRYSEAEPLYVEALAIAERVLGKDHPNTRQLRENYQRLLEEKK